MLARTAAVGLLMLALAGCGDDSTTTGNVTTVPAATATPRAEPERTAAPTAEPRRGLRLAEVGEFEAPVYATSPPGDRDNRTFVVEQGGVIRIVGQKEPFLDISGRVTAGGEQGLLSVAFAPDWRRSGLLYVYYTDNDENQRIVEYRSSPTRADPDSARLVLEMDDDESNHNGGLLLFGPDGHLYVGTGDGGGAGDEHGDRGNAQDLGSLLGKLLRIVPTGAGEGDYGVPADNPFVARKGARPEIYSYGLRNPWRFSFDRVTGALTIGDVGQGEVEEIDYVARGKGAGANFGWRPFEGDQVYAEGEQAPGHVEPVITQSHADGNCSITGGVVVRDPTLADAEGRYVFGDYCKGEIYRATLTRDRARDVAPTGLKVEGLSSFGEDNRGRVFVVSNNGPVYRLAAGS